MIRTVLDEIAASAAATLPGKIDLIAARYGVQLDSGITTYDWWKTEAEALKLAWPALSVTWAQTRTGLRDAQGGRVARHGVTLSYGVRSLDMEYIQRHVTYVPEAVLLWLDEFPTVSRAPAPGPTIVSVASGKDDAIEVSHDLVKNEGGVLIWAVDLTLAVYAYDAQLPPRST